MFKKPASGLDLRDLRSYYEEFQFQFQELQEEHRDDHRVCSVKEYDIKPRE